MKRRFDASVVEHIAFDVMVGSDIFGMLRDARRAEDFSEIAGALARLAKRAEDARRESRETRDLPGELAHALCDVLVAFHECAVAVAEHGRSERTRELLDVGRHAALEVARSAQSLRDFWRVDAPRTGHEEEGVEASFCGLNDACLRAQTFCDDLARRPAIFTGNSHWVRGLLTHGA